MSERLEAAERIALTAARGQLERGENPGINTTAQLALAVERLAALPVREPEAEEEQVEPWEDDYARSIAVPTVANELRRIANAEGRHQPPNEGVTKQWLLGLADRLDAVSPSSPVPAQED